MKNKERLDSCHPDLIELMTRVDEIISLVIIEGHRSEERQKKLLQSGATKLARGKHNEVPSLAVDIIADPVDWKDINKCYYVAGVVFATAKELGIKIRWGGDWDGDTDFKDQTFNDLVHFELV